MRKLIAIVCVLVGLGGCTSNDGYKSNGGYKKVTVSQSESKALSALGNIQGNSKQGASNVGGGSLKAAIFK